VLLLQKIRLLGRIFNSMPRELFIREEDTMNALLSIDQATDAVRQSLAKRMHAVLSQDCTPEEKVEQLSAEYCASGVVSGTFTTEREIFVGIPALSFSGFINDKKMTVTVS
jgi:hypothetical protein